MTKERVTNIQITVSIKERLNELKDHGDTYNHVIKRLLDLYDVDTTEISIEKNK